MAYNPLTDFPALIRKIGNQAAIEEMPGLDFVIMALARAGMFRVLVGQTAPVANMATTVWIKSALPSWTAESQVFLWNAGSAAYELATPTLWFMVLTQPAGTVFQIAASGAAPIAGNTSLLAVQRTAPALTNLALPSVYVRGAKPLRIVDWSTGVTNHQIALNAFGTETIMRLASFNLFSTADQLAGAELFPSIDLNGWVITP